MAARVACRAPCLARGPRAWLAVLLGLLGGGAAEAAALKGISYGVSPDGGAEPRDDDFFSAEAAPLWSRSGRGDLLVVRALGANSVRLYGNDPRLDHRGFLDEAHELGLRVMPGNSDWPFSQAPDSCMAQNNFDCRERVKASYLENLKKGFLIEDGSYHPALSHIVVMNEPDMKLGSAAHFCKALISAVDGMLEAERELRVASAGGALPNYTVTFSWAPCASCSNQYADRFVLGSMWQLRDAFLHPAKYGYSPRSDLEGFYRARFVNSFNTANPSTQMRALVLDEYALAFPETPIFIAEYHCSNRLSDQDEDLHNILSIVEATPLLLGISFFEFLKRSDAAGHQDFGIFQHGGGVVAEMPYFGSVYSIKCLVPVQDGSSTLAARVARAFGGNPQAFEASDCLTGAPFTASRAATVPSRASGQTSSTNRSGEPAAPAAAAAPMRAAAVPARGQLHGNTSEAAGRSAGDVLLP